MNVINLKGAKLFIENYVKCKIAECYRGSCKELNDTLKELKDLRATISRLISEIEEAIRVKKGVSELTSVEYMTIALAQRPNAPRSVKAKAEEIIYKYRLTKEQVKSIYESVFGRRVQT